MKKLVTSIFLVSVFVLSAFAQEVTMECKAKRSTYYEYMKMQKKTGSGYNSAKGPWAACYQSCKNYEAVYVDGLRLYSYFVDKEKDKTVKAGLLDTLFMIYDARVAAFPESKGDVLGRKGVDMVKYFPNKTQEAYELLKESVEIEKENSSAASMVAYIQQAIQLFRDGDLARDAVVDIYTSCASYADRALQQAYKDSKSTNAKKAAKAKKAIERNKMAIAHLEDLFVSSGAPDCEILIQIFTPKFEATPNDVEMLKNQLKLLDRMVCDDSELFAKIAVKYAEIEPSAYAKYYAAKALMKQEKLDESVQLLKDAIELAADDEDKAKYSYQMASVLRILKKPQEARTAARDAIKLNPKWGKPYIIIGQLYAASTKTCGSDKFEQDAVYWVAVDQFVKARSVDPSVKDEADKLIATYNKYFPGQEEIFMRGLLDKTYTVGCWINETTKVRTK